MISISLCFLIVGLIFYNVHFLNKFTVRSQIDLLYAHCMYLRQSAITENRNIVLALDPSKKSYSYLDYTYKLPSTVQFGFPDYAYGPPSRPHKKLSLPITFKNNEILFYKDGIISSGVIYLTDSSKQFLYALSNGISQFSYMRRYRYTSRWQKY